MTATDTVKCLHPLVKVDMIRSFSAKWKRETDLDYREELADFLLLLARIPDCTDAVFRSPVIPGEDLTGAKQTSRTGWFKSRGIVKERKITDEETGETTTRVSANKSQIIKDDDGVWFSPWKDVFEGEVERKRTDPETGEKVVVGVPKDKLFIPKPLQEPQPEPVEEEE